jgi:hypothetical protein
MRNIVFAFLTSLLLISCGSAYNDMNVSEALPSVDEQSKSESSGESEELSTDDTEYKETASEVVSVEKSIIIPDKIIKTASLSVEVDEYNVAIKQIRAKVKQCNGYIAAEDENNYSYMITNNITIRVLSKDFDNLVDSITTGVKKVNHKNVSSQDVTEEYVDIQARLKTKREVEARYSDLLKKANNIGDILQIEEKIRQIREEIEAKEGRLKYLTSQVEYSTIVLTVNQNFVVDQYEESFWSKIGEAMSGGWEGLLIFFVGLMYLWPLWLPIIIGLYFLLRYLKRKRAKKGK